MVTRTSNEYEFICWFAQSLNNWNQINDAQLKSNRTLFSMVQITWKRWIKQKIIFFDDLNERPFSGMDFLEVVHWKTTLMELQCIHFPNGTVKDFKFSIPGPLSHFNQLLSNHLDINDFVLFFFIDNFDSLMSNSISLIIFIM